MDASHRLQTLVETAQGGDRAAFQQLVDHYRSRLENLIQFRLGKSLRRSVEAEDVVQETLLRAYRSLERFQWQSDDSFFHWLSGITIKVILELAKKDRRSATEPLPFETATEEVSPSRGLRRQERFTRLRDSMERLSPDHRRVLLLVVEQGLPITEVARRMGRTPNAVSLLLLRATQKLKADFGDTESLGLPVVDQSLGGEIGDR